MKKVNVKQAIMKALAQGGGAVAAAKLDSIDFIGKQPVLVRGAIKIAIGAFLPQFLGKGKAGGMIADVAGGILSVGALEVANGTIFKSSPITISGPNSNWQTIGINGPNAFDENYYTVGEMENAFTSESRY